MRTLTLTVLVLVTASPVRAQQNAQASRGTPIRSESLDVEALSELGRFGESLRKFDWAQEFPHIRASLENTWDENGWTDEADLFARDVAIGVSEIPPWRPLDRISFVSDRFAERYEASDGLKLRVSLLLVREASGLFLRHGKTLMAQSTEYLEMREVGKPITARDVARWAREGQPILDDLHEVADRVIENVRRRLSPDQREILDRDFQSYAKRRETFVEMMEKWRDGKWEPKDWGMGTDGPPVSSDGIQALDAPSDVTDFAKPSASGPMPSLSAGVVGIRCDEFAPESWGACAAEIVEKFGLDAGQLTTADSIVAELSGRAGDYYKRRADRLKSIPRADWPSNAELEPIRKAYAELIERLEAIPTTAQRIRALDSVSKRPGT